MPEQDILTVRVEHEADGLVIRAFGELDLSNAETLDAELRRAIGGDAGSIVLDLSGLDFIDSTGLRVLISAAKQSRQDGARLAIRRGSEAVQQVIAVSGVDGTLPFID